MDRRNVIEFNAAYGYEPTPEERQLIENLLAVWGKLEKAAAKNPALIRKGILFGMGLQSALATGKIILRPVKEKTAGQKPKLQADDTGGSE